MFTLPSHPFLTFSIQLNTSCRADASAYGTHTHNPDITHARAEAHTADRGVCLPVGTLCKFYMRAKLVCGMWLCLVCVPEQGGCVKALNLK